MFQTFAVSNNSKTEDLPAPLKKTLGEYVSVRRTMRAKLPFSIGQIGKAFRNEIAGNTFHDRVRADGVPDLLQGGLDAELYDYFKAYGRQYFEEVLPRTSSALPRPREAAHYAKAGRATSSPLFLFGWGEINGTHNRTNFDLYEASGIQRPEDGVPRPETNEKFIPFIIESTYGLDRTVLALLAEAYDEEVLDAEKNDVRVVLRLNPAVAPYKAAVLPLSKKLPARRSRFTTAFRSALWSITTSPVPSASATAGRMKSARRSVSRTISTVRRTGV